MIAEEFLALQEIPAIFAFRPDVELFCSKLNSLLLNYSRYVSKKALGPTVDSSGPIRLFVLPHNHFFCFTPEPFFGLTLEASSLRVVNLRRSTCH